MQDGLLASAADEAWSGYDSTGGTRTSVLYPAWHFVRLHSAVRAGHTRTIATDGSPPDPFSSIADSPVVWCLQSHGTEARKGLKFFVHHQRQPSLHAEVVSLALCLHIPTAQAFHLAGARLYSAGKPRGSRRPKLEPALDQPGAKTASLQRRDLCFLVAL